jgi:hypothetical protein
MELAFLTPLLKNGAESVSGGIAINDKGFLKAWLAKDGGGANRIDEGVKHGSMFIVPVELATLSAMGHERVKRGGEHAKTVDIHSVEIEKAKKSA